MEARRRCPRTTCCRCFPTARCFPQQTGNESENESGAQQHRLNLINSRIIEQCIPRSTSYYTLAPPH